MSYKNISSAKSKLYRSGGDSNSSTNTISALFYSKNNPNHRHSPSGKMKRSKGKSFIYKAKKVWCSAALRPCKDKHNPIPAVLSK